MLLFLKNVLYAVAVPATVAVYLPLYIVHNRTVTSPGPFFIAIVFLAIGAGIVIKSIWDFAAFGHATPAPIDPPKKLVIRGLYRHIRNPIYLGVVTIILGWALLYQSTTLLYYAFWTGAFFQGFIMLYEEPHLRREFGNEYEQYCARVGRWLPSVFRRPTD
ncbi:MAG: methyltransferase family protein [Gammaproteobacteria bacterium]